MRRRPRFAVQLLVCAAAFAGLAPTGASADTFVVDSTGDASDADLSDFVCDDGTGACTLRAAIENANYPTPPTTDRIEFDIPGSGPHVISTVGPYGYAITGQLEIDGTTQAGWSPNASPAFSNAVLPIEIEGGGAATQYGLIVDHPHVVLRGLVIRDFERCVTFNPNALASKLLGSRISGCESAGVHVHAADLVRIGDTPREARNVISGIGDNGVLIDLTAQEDDDGSIDGANENFIVNNVIGSGAWQLGSSYTCASIRDSSRNYLTDNVISGCFTGVLFYSAYSNTLARNGIRGNFYGVHLLESTANVIGLPSATLAHANQISGNAGKGVWIQYGSANVVQGNQIGTRGGPQPALPNDEEGILIESSNGNTIGAGPTDVVAGQGNEIAFNHAEGVVIGAYPSDVTAIDNSIRGNRIFSNGVSFGFRSMDIDLGFNDEFDGDDVSSTPGEPDPDEGPNHFQNAPRITNVALAQGQTQISGSALLASGSFQLDFYSSVECGGFVGGRELGHGQFYLGSSPFSHGGLNYDEKTFEVTLPTTAQGHAFSATATDLDGNTSEFGPCFGAPVGGDADVSLQIDVDPPEVDAGEAVVLTLTLANQGPSEATDVPVRIPEPAGFTSWLADPSQGSYDEASGLWSAGSLASGATATLVVTAEIDAARVDPIQVDAEAHEGLAQLDFFLSNNDAQALVIIRSGADLVLSQTAPFSAEHGELFTFELTVTNTGPEPAFGVMLSGHLEEGIDFAAPLPFAFDPQTRRWAYLVGDLDEDASDTLEVDARIAQDAIRGTALAHKVAAFAESPEESPTDMTDNLTTVRVAVSTAADLSIFPAGTSVDGDVETQRFRVTNNGPDGVEGFRFVVTSCGDLALIILNPPSEPSFPVQSTSCVVEGAEEAGTCPLVCDLELPIEAGAQRIVSIQYSRSLQAHNLTAGIEASPDDAPFYDPDSSNSALNVVATGTLSGFSLGKCGLTGVEPLIPLLAGLALAKRRARRARGRAASVLLLLLGAVSLAPAPAGALPIVFAVDGAASSASVAITSPIATSPVTIAASGTLQADVALAVDPLFGLVADSLQLTGAQLAFSDAALVLANPPLSTLTFTGTGVGASLLGPLASGFAVAPGRSLFDLVGSVLTFDTGTIAATGTHFGVPVDLTLDLALASISSVYPVNSVAQARVTNLGGGAATLRLSLPFSAPVRIAVDDTLTTVTFAGQLVLNGTVVPEPSTFGLLAFGLAALTATHARRRSSARDRTSSSRASTSG